MAAIVLKDRKNKVVGTSKVPTTLFFLPIIFWGTTIPTWVKKQSLTQ